MRSRRLNILLADDCERFAWLVQLLLGEHDVDVAANGEIAVRKFRSGGYDLVLMDLKMPVMDGYAATRAIRTWEEEEGRMRVPILALTGEDDTARSRAAGCNGHLMKPAGRNALREAVSRYENAAVERETGGAATSSVAFPAARAAAGSRR